MVDTGSTMTTSKRYQKREAEDWNGFFGWPRQGMRPGHVDKSLGRAADEALANRDLIVTARCRLIGGWRTSAW